ncbi:hypothetical protein D3C80_1197300 [compost metagenome]
MAQDGIILLICITADCIQFIVRGLMRTEEERFTIRGREVMPQEDAFTDLMARLELRLGIIQQQEDTDVLQAYKDGTAGVRLQVLIIRGREIMLERIKGIMRMHNGDIRLQQMEISGHKQDILQPDAELRLVMKLQAEIKV